MCSFGEDFRPLADFVSGRKHPMQDKDQKHTIVILVTTPHGCKPGASGMTRVCRPTPVVRFMHTSETKLTATCVSHGTCRRLGRSCFYPRELTLEPANTIELSVCKRTTQTFFCEKTKVESVLRLRAARLSSPCVNAGAFRRGLINKGVYDAADISGRIRAASEPGASQRGSGSERVGQARD